MVTKYDFFDIFEQLFEDLEGAYPARWKDLEAATILGGGIFGSPKPHPNAVLNLFEEQGFRFAIPFAAYRVSLDGFLAVMDHRPSIKIWRKSTTGVISIRRQAETSNQNFPEF
jgi:hypothetical protein